MKLQKSAIKITILIECATYQAFKSLPVEVNNKINFENVEIRFYNNNNNDISESNRNSCESCKGRLWNDDVNGRFAGKFNSGILNPLD